MFATQRKNKIGSAGKALARSSELMQKELGLVGHTCDSSTEEEDTRGCLELTGQSA